MLYLVCVCVGACTLRVWRLEEQLESALSHQVKSEHKVKT